MAIKSARTRPSDINIPLMSTSTPFAMSLHFPLLKSVSGVV